MEFVNTVKEQGAGFVPYLWPKPGSDKPVPVDIRLIATTNRKLEAFVAALLHAGARWWLRYEAAVAADIDLARQIGVTGVPFVVVDMKYAVSGAQPPEVFREVVGSRTTTRGCAAPRSG